MDMAGAMAHGGDMGTMMMTHGADMEGGGGDMPMPMDMPMYFTNSIKITLFIKAWATASTVQYVVALVAMLAFSMYGRARAPHTHGTAMAPARVRARARVEAGEEGPLTPRGLCVTRRPRAAAFTSTSRACACS